MVPADPQPDEIQQLYAELADLKHANRELQKRLEEHDRDRQRAELALQSSEAELHALFAAMTDIVLVKDYQGRYLKIAPTQLDDLYKLPEELIGKTEHEVLPKEIADRFVDYVQQVLNTQTPLTVEFSLPIRGEERWFSTNIAPLSDHSVIWVARNINDRKQTEEALIAANQQITQLNHRLQAENLRMSAELEITRRLQEIVLPRTEELAQIAQLEIAAFMEPATEVGGDYYDILQQNGKVQIGIGDVTGHGLESGVVMLMAQTAIRTLLTHGETNLAALLSTINQILCSNTQRIGFHNSGREPHRSMTLALLEYDQGTLRLTGQHEELIIIRTDGTIETIDTFELGFPLGLEADITPFLAEITVPLSPGDVAVLYTDGITEAMNLAREQYGLERIYEVLKQHRHASAQEICQAAIANLRQFIGTQTVFDDITLVVIKPTRTCQPDSL